MFVFFVSSSDSEDVSLDTGAVVELGQVLLHLRHDVCLEDRGPGHPPWLHRLRGVVDGEEYLLTREQDVQQNRRGGIEAQLRLYGVIGQGEAVEDVAGALKRE